MNIVEICQVIVTFLDLEHWLRERKISRKFKTFSKFPQNLPKMRFAKQLLRMSLQDRLFHEKNTFGETFDEKSKDYSSFDIFKLGLTSKVLYGRHTFLDEQMLQILPRPEIPTVKSF